MTQVPLHPKAKGMSLLEFPVLAADNKAYLDNAATSLMPRHVIQAMESFESGFRSNAARGIYPWAERATEAYENARSIVAKALEANKSEVIFTSGATDSINLAADFVKQLTKDKRKKVLLTEMEHHSNIVPWQLRFGGNRKKIAWAKCGADGLLDMDAVQERIKKGDVAAIAITHASNVTGVVNDIKAIAKTAKKEGCLVVADGAQFIPHSLVNPRDGLGADFYAFSGHKCNGPMGIGVLWGRQELLERLEPVKGGGGMVVQVKAQSTSFADTPHRFESGTPNVAGAIGLGAAFSMREKMDVPSWDEIQDLIMRIDEKVLETLSKVDGVEILGPKSEVARVPIRSFNIKGVHPHDVCQVFGEEDVYVRGGHHCAMPLMTRLGVDACVRVSLGPHVAERDVSRLSSALDKAIGVLS